MTGWLSLIFSDYVFVKPYFMIMVLHILYCLWYYRGYILVLVLNVHVPFCRGDDWC